MALLIVTDHAELTTTYEVKISLVIQAADVDVAARKLSQLGHLLDICPAVEGWILQAVAVQQ